MSCFEDKLKKLQEGNLEPNIFPFLWLRGEDEDTLREYMRVIYDANMRAVCLESRPHPDFLGPGWWHDLDIVLEEAKQRGMKVWILDDSHFPTGYAGGAMENAPERLCRQSIMHREMSCPPFGQVFCAERSRWAVPPAWIPNGMEQALFVKTPPRRFSDDEILSITALRTDRGGEQMDLTGQKELPVLTFRVPEGEWKLVFVYKTRNAGPHRNYINMMDEDSCRVLIDTVYEPHYARYAKEFGKTIAGFFSDEPELGNDHLYEFGKRIYENDNLAWSRRVETALQKRWGEKFGAYLPLLWEKDGREELFARVRYDYMDEVTNAVRDCFSVQIGDWCRAHGVEYIGHMIEDDHQHTRTGSSLGHYFRGLWGQDMAGIDNIGGQVLPQGETIAPFGSDGRMRDGMFYHYTLAKLGTSLAAIDSKKKGRTMCEIFGAYGWKEGVRLEKYLADHFLVRGVKRFVPHAFSMRPFPDPDCPPHFYAHGHNPQYRHFACLMAYLSRLCTLLDGGRRVAHVAVLYNAAAEWTGEFMYLQELTAPLLDQQIDFDFLPEDVFVDPEPFRASFGEKLTVNGRSYDLLLVPGAQFLTEASLLAIEKLAGALFPVWFVGRKPEGACDVFPGGRTQSVAISHPDNVTGSGQDEGNHLCSETCLEAAGCELVEKEDLPSRLRAARDTILRDTVRLFPENDRIRVLHNRNGGDLFLLVNEGTQPYKGTISFPAAGRAALYDAWENRLQRLETEEDGNGLHLVIEPGKSICLLFGLAEEALRKNITETASEGARCCGATEKLLRDGWIRSICRTEEYPAFHDHTRIALPDHLALEQPSFSGFVRYERELTLCERPDGTGELKETGAPGKAATVRIPDVLEISDAFEGVELFVNGRSAGIQIAPPFRYQVSHLLHGGSNQIAIEVATSLERQMAGDQNVVYIGDDREKEPKCPSGINGMVLVLTTGSGKGQK